MRRISTLFILCLSISLFTAKNATGQCTNVAGGTNNNATCTLGATEDFEPATSTYGFGPTTTWSNTSGYLEATPPNNNTLILRTPTFLVDRNTVNLRFELSHSNVSSFDVYVVTSSTLLTPTLLCSGLTLSNMSGNTQLACYQLNLSAYSGQRIQLELVFHTASNAKLFFDNFGIDIPSAIALPVNFINFQGKGVSSGMQLTWTVANEERLARYEIEKSTNGVSYTTIGSVTTLGQSAYTFTDVTPSGSLVYYRIKSVDDNGSYRYSSTLRFDHGKSSVVLKAFPLPAASILTVQHGAAAQGARITLSAEDGRTVRVVTPALSAMQTPLDLSNLRTGMYLLRFDDGAGNVETLKIIKQ